MKKNAQVQTNNHNVNVLVETTDSNNRHYSHLNKDVHVIKTLSDEEIIELWENRTDNDKLEIAKNWIKKQEGYAISSCKDKTLGINYNSVVKYK